ncbi:hypothetical protein BB559_005767 [Furculomyces boomerangus]|uniref:OPT superfamily oligopeptide transporter n=1 Tax=Furculomyces boomerangus TaxID=61424 RepID=A0A2T9Y6V3_9FUNG|nr:hypothetical protein BB559_005767 [Furculomyces boomerangus]
MDDVGYLKTKYMAQIESPVDIVAASVLTGDNPETPCLTVRFWILSTVMTIGLSAISQYSYFKPFLWQFSFVTVQVLSYPLGKFLEWVLPKSDISFFGQKVLLNPSEFNFKEHMLICVAAVSGGGFAEAINLITIDSLILDKNISSVMDFGKSLALIIFTQILGFGISGYLLNILVRPSAMVWPSTLVNVTLFNTLHKRYVNGKVILKLVVLMLIILITFVYQLFPLYVYPELSSIAILCYLGYKSQLAINLGSGFRGLGIMNFSFDWNIIGLIQPLVTPFWAQVNFYAGSVFMLWIIMPILYFGFNAWDSRKHGIVSKNLYSSDNNLLGMDYFLSIDNSARIKTQTNSTNLKLSNLNMNSTVGAGSFIKSSPEIMIPAYMIMACGFAFAAIASTISHTWLYYRHSIKKRITGNNDQNDDIHVKGISVYKPVSGFLFFTIFLVSLVGLVYVGKNSGYSTSNWHVLISVTLSVVLSLPIGIIQAISNIQISSRIFFRVIQGLLSQNNNAVSNGFFTLIGSNTISQCLEMVSNFKMGLYLKVPPRKVFLSQFYGCIIGAITNLAVYIIILRHKKDELSSILVSSNLDNLGGSYIEHANGFGKDWSIGSARKFYISSIIWSIVGPNQFYGFSSKYKYIYIVVSLGFLLPIPFYYLYKNNPERKWHLVNVPLFMFGTLAVTMVSTNYIISGFLVGFLFQFVICRYCHEFWEKYNYLSSGGLDVGNELCIGFLFICFSILGKSLGIGRWTIPKENLESCFYEKSM